MARHRFLIAVLFAIVLALVLWGALSKHRNHHSPQRITRAQIEEDVRRHLAIGMSQAEVSSYLDQKGIPHTYFGSDFYKDSPSYQCEVGMIHDASSSGIVSTDIQLVFRYDTNRRLASYKVQEIHTGP